MIEESQTQAVFVSSVLQDLQTPRASIFNPADQEMGGSLGHFQLLLSTGCCSASLLCGRLICPVHCPGYGNGIPEKCAYVLSSPSSQLCLCELQPVFLGLVRSQMAFWEPRLEQGAPLFTPFP